MRGGCGGGYGVGVDYAERDGGGEICRAWAGRGRREGAATVGRIDTGVKNGRSRRSRTINDCLKNIIQFVLLSASGVFSTLYRESSNEF